MSITKLKWQWQSSTSNPNDLANVATRLQYGRVITGMLTDYQPEPNHTTTRTSGGSERDKTNF